MTTGNINLKAVQSSTFLQTVEWFAEIDSTNSYSVRTVEQSRALPALVGADSQSSGRGRGRNQWWGGQGSLTFSVIMAPADYGIGQQQWPLLSLLVGLSIAEGLASFAGHANVQLKWPNDVYMEGRKICGILMETASARTDIVIVGVGINVNNSFEQAPADVRSRATSLAEQTSVETSAEQVLVATLQQLQRVVERFETEAAALLDSYRERCFLTGKQLAIDSLQGLITGTCLGIDDDGALRLMTAAGTQRVLAGSVTILEN